MDVAFDGVIKSEFKVEQGHLVHKQTQPTENLILERNQELRKNPGALRDLGEGQEGGTWGRQLACIPTIKFYKAIKDGYDFLNKDSKIANREMMRFLLSEDGKECLVRDKV